MLELIPGTTSGHGVRGERSSVGAGTEVVLIHVELFASASVIIPELAAPCVAQFVDITHPVHECGYLANGHPEPQLSNRDKRETVSQIEDHSLCCAKACQGAFALLRLLDKPAARQNLLQVISVLGVGCALGEWSVDILHEYLPCVCAGLGPSY